MGGCRIATRHGQLTCRRNLAADLHATSGQSQQQTRNRSPSVPLCGSRKGPGPTCLPMRPDSYQHHERTLMKDASGQSFDRAPSTLAVPAPIAGTAPVIIREFS